MEIAVADVLRILVEHNARLRYELKPDGERVVLIPSGGSDIALHCDACRQLDPSDIGMHILRLLITEGFVVAHLPYEDGCIEYVPTEKARDIRA